MKFMSAKARPRNSQDTLCDQSHRPVPKVQPALGERGFERQQPGHGVARALGIDQSLAEHHVAAAFAMNRSVSRRRRSQPAEERHIGGQAASVQLGIASRQVDRGGRAVGGGQKGQMPVAKERLRSYF